MRPVTPQPEADLSLIGSGDPAANEESLRLYTQELQSYSAIDEEDDLAFERRVKHAFHVRELKQIDDIIKSRKSYANKIFLLVVCWLIGMAVLLLLSGFGVFEFKLNDKVLLALIGGTTLNVLGIFTIVANFLFPKSGHSIMSRSGGKSMNVGRSAAQLRSRRLAEAEGGR